MDDMMSAHDGPMSAIDRVMRQFTKNETNIEQKNIDSPRISTPILSPIPSLIVLMFLKTANVFYENK